MTRGGTPSATAIVRGVLRDRPGAYLSAHTLIAVTGLTADKVNIAITALIKQGQVERLFFTSPTHRESPQAYRWITK